MMTTHPSADDSGRIDVIGDDRGANGKSRPVDADNTRSRAAIPTHGQDVKLVKPVLIATAIIMRISSEWLPVTQASISPYIHTSSTATPTIHSHTHYSSA